MKSMILFQRQSVFECITDPFGDFVIPVCIGIEGDRVHAGNVYLTVLQYAFFRGYVYDFSDHAQTVSRILIFDETAFQTDGKFVDDRRVDAG